METSPQSLNICIVCSLEEEVRAFAEIFQQHYEGALEDRISERYQYSYRFARLKNKQNESLNLHISWPSGYGPQEMALHLSRVLEERRPLMAILTGICAGDARYTQLGDLVVAERTFTYDNGKFLPEENGKTIHQHDTTTYQPDANIRQFLRLFDDWKSPIGALEHPPSLSKRPQITCHIKAMASGNAVRADHPFDDIQVPLRGAIAIDMEGAAFGLVMSRHPSIGWLVVKGVSDFADLNKNDMYHDFAARASALYALTFIRAYVTRKRFTKRIPRRTLLIGGGLVTLGVIGVFIKEVVDQSSSSYSSPIYLQLSLGSNIYSLAWSPDNEYIASAADQIVQVWNPVTASTVFNDGDSLKVSRGVIKAVDWLPKSSEYIVAYGGGSEKNFGRVFLTHLQTGLRVPSPLLTDSVHTVACSPSGDYIASGGNDKQVSLWNTDLAAFPFQVPHNDSVNAIAWSPDNQYIVSGSEDGMIKVWEVNTRSDRFPPLQVRQPVCALAWSPDGKHIVSGCGGGISIQVWNAQSGKLVSSYDGNTQDVWALAWSPDSKYILSGGSDCRVRIWDALSGEDKWWYQNKTAAVTAVGWSPDGKHIAFVGDNSTIWVYNVESLNL
jgi:WD40 repeat protein/nucleoside phosphorylase